MRIAKRVIITESSPSRTIYSKTLMRKKIILRAIMFFLAPIVWTRCPLIFSKLRKMKKTKLIRIKGWIRTKRNNETIHGKKNTQKILIFEQNKHKLFYVYTFISK